MVRCSGWWYLLFQSEFENFLTIRSTEQHRWTSFGIQYQNLRCKTSRLKQTCMLFSVWSRLKKDEIHLQVKNILQYGCYIFQTFLLCAMGPYLSANKKSFEYSLNWRNSGEMYTVIHIGYHGGLSTEMLFNRESFHPPSPGGGARRTYFWSVP